MCHLCNFARRKACGLSGNTRYRSKFSTYHRCSLQVHCLFIIEGSSCVGQLCGHLPAASCVANWVVTCQLCPAVLASCFANCVVACQRRCQLCCLLCWPAVSPTVGSLASCVGLASYVANCVNTCQMRCQLCCQLCRSAVLPTVWSLAGNAVRLYQDAGDTAL